MSTNFSDQKLHDGLLGLAGEELKRLNAPHQPRDVWATEKKANETLFGEDDDDDAPSTPEEGEYENTTTSFEVARSPPAAIRKKTPVQPWARDDAAAKKKPAAQPPKVAGKTPVVHSLPSADIKEHQFYESFVHQLGELRKKGHLTASDEECRLLTQAFIYIVHAHVMSLPHPDEEVVKAYKTFDAMLHTDSWSNMANVLDSRHTDLLAKFIKSVKKAKDFYHHVTTLSSPQVCFWSSRNLEAGQQVFSISMNCVGKKGDKEKRFYMMLDEDWIETVQAIRRFRRFDKYFLAKAQNGHILSIANSVKNRRPDLLTGNNIFTQFLKYSGTGPFIANCVAEFFALKKVVEGCFGKINP